MRIGAHLAIFLAISSLVEPLFTALYLVFAAVHVHMKDNSNNSRLPFQYAILFLAVLAMPLNAELALANPNNSSVGGGLPSVVERVELVEKVLEVEKITKQPEFTLLGTDYQPGDEGKILAYVLEGNQPVTNALCLVSVLYPNNTVFIDNAMMSEFDNTAFSGMYYYDFLVPNITGVYAVAALCEYGATTVIDLVDFEGGNLTEAAGSEGIIALNPEQEGIQEFTGDGFCDGPGGSNINCQWLWNISLPNGAVNEFLNDFRIILRSHTDAAETFTYSAYDYNNSVWVDFTSVTQGTPPEPTTYQFEINQSFISPDDKVSVRTSVFEFDSPQNLEVYDLYISRTYNTTFIQDMRGSNEIVVSEGVFFGTEVIELVYNDTQTIINTNPEIVGSEQIGQIIVIILFLALMITGYWLWAGFFGIFYAFTYLEGIFAISLLVVMSIIIYFGKNRKDR